MTNIKVTASHTLGRQKSGLHSGYIQRHLPHGVLDYSDRNVLLYPTHFLVVILGVTTSILVPRHAEEKDIMAKVLNFMNQYLICIISYGSVQE